MSYGSIISGQMPDAVYSEWWNNSFKRAYTYDSLNQLVREDNEKLGKTYTYSYLNGNRKHETRR